MKISAIQNITTRNAKPLFRAGKTEFFSDFDGTFMPHKYRHDVFCNDLPTSPRRDFLESGKKEFQEYFDAFGEFLDKLRGQGDKKLNFTITSGRNRPEFNYFIKRIREDGLTVPLPDQLVIRNGGDIYTKRKDIDDFFATAEKELFLKTDFSQEKRDMVKTITKGWDGDEAREVIINYFKTNLGMNEVEKMAEAAKLWDIIAPAVDDGGNFYDALLAQYDKIILSDMKEPEIIAYIQNLAGIYKEQQTTGLDDAEKAIRLKEIDDKIGDIAYKIAKAKQGGFAVFEADTDGAFYAEGMHFDSKRKMMTPPPERYVALKDNGNLEFHLNLPRDTSQKEILEFMRADLDRQLGKGGVRIISKTHRAKGENGFGEIIIRPAIEGKKINKVFDTKLQVEKIIQGGLNDLVVVAGDDSNDVRMLDLFEYIELEKNDKPICEKNLRKIYDLPVISIYVDNSADKTGGKSLVTSKTRDSLEDLEKYFNSDGNVRFIHVVPNNTSGKPQSLLEGLQIALREYAKRNPEFEKNLSPEMQELIKQIKTDYPIDKKFTQELEQALGAKLWNPVTIKETIEETGTNTIKKGIKKGHLALIACAVAAVTGIFAFIKNKKARNPEKPDENKVKK